MTRRKAFAFLAATHKARGETVRRIDTHAASVFLVDNRALKVNRAVRFPFLDYSRRLLGRYRGIADMVEL